MNLFLKPIITERSVSLAKRGFYTFGVEKKARKSEIKKTVKQLFGVDVVSIKTVKMPKKTKRSIRTGKFNILSEWKKAIVKVKKGQKIDIFEVSE